VCFLGQLEDEEVQTRVAGCVALGCLKVRWVHEGAHGVFASRLSWLWGGWRGTDAACCCLCAAFSS